MYLIPPYLLVEFVTLVTKKFVTFLGIELVIFM